MGRQYECYTLCPEAYNLLSNPTALAEALGYENVDEFYESFFMDNREEDLNNFRANFKPWNQEVPGGYGSSSCYIIPAQMVLEKEYLVDGLVCDINEAICGEGCDYHTFLLSTEDWQII